MNEELKKALESAGTEEDFKKILSEHQLTEEDLKQIAGGEFPWMPSFMDELVTHIL